MVLEIEPETDNVVNAEFTFVTELARDSPTRRVPYLPTRNAGCGRPYRTFQVVPTSSRTT